MLEINDILDIEAILRRKNYSKIYSAILVLIVIIMIFIYVIFTYKYQDYFLGYARVVDNNLEISVDNQDIKYFIKNKRIELDGKMYQYEIVYIDSYDEVDSDYQYVYIKANVSILIDNYIYQVKLPKENLLLAEYLKKYL